MTFEEFQGSHQWCDDLGTRLREAAMPPGTRGWLYCGKQWGGLYIEDASTWPADAPGFGNGRWYTIIGRMEYQSDDLEEIERHLYGFALVEGYTL